MNSFLYPPRLKDPKLLFLFTVKDIAILTILIMIFSSVAVKMLSLLPLMIPIIYAILFVRILENKENVIILLIRCFKYFLSTQQTYFWGIKG